MEDNKLKAIASEILQNFLAALKLVQTALTKRDLAWQDFKNLSLAPKELILKYFLPVAVVGAFASVIKLSIIGVSLLGTTVRMPFFSTLFFSLTQIVVMVAAIIIAALIINKLSQNESLGKPTSTDAVISWLIYGSLISTSAQLLAFIPFLNWIAALALGLYALYFLWQGASQFLEQSEKCLQFCAVSFVTMLIVGAILFTVHSQIIGSSMPNQGTAEELNIKLNQDLQNSLDRLIQK